MNTVFMSLALGTAQAPAFGLFYGDLAVGTL
jgi:hypothetical protein